MEIEELENPACAKEDLARGKRSEGCTSALGCKPKARAKPLVALMSIE